MTNDVKQIVGSVWWAVKNSVLNSMRESVRNYEEKCERHFVWKFVEKPIMDSTWYSIGKYVDIYLSNKDIV